MQRSEQDFLRICGRALTAQLRRLVGLEGEVARLRAGASNPVGLAEEFCLVLEGSYVTHQVSRRPETAAVMRRVVSSIVDRYLPAVVADGRLEAAL